MKPVNKAFLIVFTGLFLLTGAGPERPRVILGAVLPMSGPQAPFGKEAERGIRLALEVQNAADPASGAAWTLVVGDDTSAQEAAAAAERLVSKDKAHLLLGALTGPSTLAVAEVASTRQRPLVVALASAPAATVGPMVTRVCFDDSMQGAILGEFLATTLGSKSGAVLRDDSAAAAGIAVAFEAALKARGGGVTASEVYNLASEDYQPALKALAVKGAKYVLLPSSYMTAAAVMKQARAAGLSFVFLGTEAWDTPRFTSAAAEAGQGHYFVTSFADDDLDPVTVAFVTAFKAKYGRAPGSLAALAYDGTLMAAEAVKRAGSNQAAPLMREFNHLKDWKGVTGTVTLGANGEFLKSGVVKATTLRGAEFKARVLPLVGGGLGAGAGGALTVPELHAAAGLIPGPTAVPRPSATAAPDVSAPVKAP